MEIYIQLLRSVVLPTVISILFYLVMKKSKFAQRHKWVMQIILGLVFGVIAIMGTQFGVTINGATVNARDAAPLCAGLLFGAPAGIISGFIGGIWRWYAALWGAGMYSRVACTVSTILAGFYAAFLRKFMFDNKRPGMGVAFMTAIVMEVIHLSILFFTHLSDPVNAYEIVKISTLPMLLCNAVSVALSVFGITLISKGFHKGKKHISNIAQKVQARMLVCVVLAYFVTTSFVYLLQTGTAVSEAEELMKQNVVDVKVELLCSTSYNRNKIALNRHLDKNGFMIILNEKNEVISKPLDKKIDSFKDSDFGITEFTEKNKYYIFKSEDEKYYCMYDEVGVYKIIALIPEEDVFSARETTVYVNSFMEILVFAVLFTLIYFLIKKLVVKNIRSVNNDLEKIIGGDLSVTVDVRSSSEFASLSDDINSTVETLNRYIKEAAARIDAELSFAKSIQSSALPSVFPAFPNHNEFDIYASMDTAKEVGGDFYDFYLINNKLYFLIADVSGKGIPAAMFMMRAKTMIKNLAEEGLEVNDIFSEANKRLCEGNDAGMFVTAWMGALDILTGHVTFANAGHNPPLVYNKDENKFSYLVSKAGFVLAGMEGIKYKIQELDLKPGERIYLYTDGVTEANNKREELYGEDRLLELLNKNVDLDSEGMLKAVKKDIDVFADEAEQFDDITMLTVKYM